MIDRLLELNLPVNKMLANHPDDLADFALSDIELNVLYDIREFLAYAHSVQELVSAEQTPTLCIVIALYEQLIKKLQDAKEDLPKFAHALDAAIGKLQEYLTYSRKAKIYNLAIVLNPQMKLAWIRKNWSTEDFATARDHVRRVMLEFQRSARQAGTTSSLAPPTTPAARLRRTETVPLQATPGTSSARALKSGYSKFHQLGRKTASLPSVSSSSGLTLSPEECRQRDDAMDERIVELELKEYEQEGLLGGGDLPDDTPQETLNKKLAELDNFDILRY